MAYAPYEFLQVVKESAYGTAMTSPVAGTDSIYIRLTGANYFTPRPVPGYVTVPFGGGFAVEGYRKYDKYVISGNLQLELCYSQAHILLDWAITRLLTAGSTTTPWASTEPSGDLASCSVYHGIMRDDGTIKRRHYKGVKVHNWRLAFADGQAAKLTLGLQASKMDGNTIDSTTDPDATAFPAPADTAFPTDVVLFPHLGSNVSIAGSAVQYYQSLELAATNQMDTRFFPGVSPYFATFDRLRGRAATADAKVLYTASPDWRAAYEAITKEAASFSATNGTNTIEVTFNASNVIDPLRDDVQPGKVHDQQFTLHNQWDTSASQDIAFTYT
jgi:hypothetical protein